MSFNGRYTSGCLICGGELYNIPGKSLLAKCNICGKEEATHTFCMNGHYVCDDCHRGEILELVLSMLMENESKDPVEMALEVFEIEGLNMNGPEYHSIFPGILVAAYGNVKGNKSHEMVKEAMNRGKMVNGGFCGSHGACGAALGLGIAASVINGATPYSTVERCEANRLVSLALAAISESGGARCCKRDGITAIKVFKDELGCFEYSGKEYICSQFPDNEVCILARCPYFPGENQ